MDIVTWWRDKFPFGIRWWFRKTRLMHFYFDTKYRIRNLWVFRNTLWNARPWDYSAMLLAMKDSLIGMEYSQRKYGNHLHGDYYCDKMKICINLLDRIIEDDYDTNKWEFIPDEDECLGLRMEPKYDLPGKKLIHKRYSKQREEDLEYLTVLMNKYLFHWWD